MAYLDIVTVLAVLQFLVFGFQVGGAREKYGVKAPATSGNEQFERVFRIQQNTLELLVALIPGLYLFGRYWNPLLAAALGVVYLVGRQLYAVAYAKNPAKRGPGFGLSFLPVAALLLGGLTGAVWHLVHG
ncbi:MAG TPA: MAPEG family protein [Steroidobacteraceae bacterium]|nr:MAPEG family protein [Steroidobacteraceae bacterium]